MRIWGNFIRSSGFLPGSPSVNFLSFSHWHGSKADQKFPKPDQNFIDQPRPENAYFYHLSHSKAI
jgi:hypothetical protein